MINHAYFPEVFIVLLGFLCSIRLAYQKDKSLLALLAVLLKKKRENSNGYESQQEMVAEAQLLY